MTAMLAHTPRKMLGWSVHPNDCALVWRWSPDPRPGPSLHATVSPLHHRKTDDARVETGYKGEAAARQGSLILRDLPWFLVH